MSKTIVSKGLSILFNSQLIKVLADDLMDDLAIEAGKKASRILKEHFTFTAAEIAKNFQDSYGYALAAISSGLATPENQRGFFKTIFTSKINNEFSAQLERDYLAPFATQQGLSDEDLVIFRQQAVEHCQTMAKLKLFQGEERVFSEAELASFVSTHKAESLTQLLLKLVQQQHNLNYETIACLQFKDLLGHSLLFFLYEQLRKEPRFQTTLANLQQQGLMINVSEIKTLVKSTQDTLKQAIDAQELDEMGGLVKKLKCLKKVELITKEHYSEWLAFNRQFSHWSQLMELSLDQILLELPRLSQQLKSIKSDAEQIKSDVKKLLAILKPLMARSDLSLPIKPRDELAHHNTASLQQIKQAVELSRSIAPSSPQYSQIAMLLGSVMSSKGDLKQAEVFFTQAYQQANNDDDRASSQFNLFQIFIRQQIYDKAFTSLKQAIALNPDVYALHDVENYTLQRILGAGGMGCVFLATHILRNEQVVIKCFWEVASSSSDELFKEAFLMAGIAGEYIPQPLDHGFADRIHRQRGFFVTEYIPEAIDGEAWLAKHGAFDVQTGIAVGLQIAKGLQVAHQKGIYHLDLKPANILLKRLKNSEIQVKIIDFGLANIAPSLGQEMAKNNHKGLSLLTQNVAFGTADYAPPEQQGVAGYGSPSAKSDVYSFGKTLYRLLTEERPQTLRPKHLNKEKLFELLCDCVDDNPKHRPTMTNVIQKLESIKRPSKQPRRWLKIAILGTIVSSSLLVAWSQLSSSPSLTELIKKLVPPDPKPQHKAFEPEMLSIPTGSFMMGCVSNKNCDTNEKPVQIITMNSFMMAKTEVTFAEWDACVQAKGCSHKPDDEGWGRDQRPVINVSWEDVQQYIQWLNKETNKPYRLPTEAEWEYAARANTTTKYSWGNDNPSCSKKAQNGASHDGGKDSNCYNKPHDQYRGTEVVASYKAAINPWGLYDMHGNVWEWTSSVYNRKYEKEEKFSTREVKYRSVRGGSWMNKSKELRSAVRFYYAPDGKGMSIGFRLVLDQPRSSKVE